MIRKEISYFFSSSPANGALNVSKDGSTFSVQLTDPIQVPNEAINATIEIQSASIWNNSFNISEELKNNTFSFYYPYASTKQGINAYNQFTIPDGQYSFDAFNDMLAHYFVGYGFPPDIITFGADTATNKLIVIVKKELTKVDFSNVTWDFGGWKDMDDHVVGRVKLDTSRNLLGFTAGLYPNNGELRQIGSYPAKFNHINSIVLRSDLLGNGISVNDTSSGALANILINVKPNSLIAYMPYNPNKVDASELISHARNYITFTLTDITGVLINTNTEFYNFSLVLRYDLYPQHDRQSSNASHPRFA